ncbi:Hermansky-Pudlak syndrome 4 protein isoform X2 [Amblyraja radiata]|uniref:Hermansky-Pudlak syndrome 4 protein isoform X2 n=1 Tax=Amblyraja radiata TaxID=386614 RepID=UPI0014041109|nr:Hermansky-Pudlak syndrome 4 protein isoform X2 [Amblyraja radiata]
MATAVAADQKSWCSYFFLYDSSKVKEEGDPTRAGIYYFYPSQTTADQQELLCGQVAGVVCCITEISGSPPTLIRLRKLKFAVQVSGEYLWVLGCVIDVPDVSCKHSLDHLIGVFTFYNGASQHIYKLREKDALARQWDIYMRHIQENSGGLHRTFNSLWNLDRTDVDPLLLLKAALILQSCQRCPEILAGCILYTNLIVSSQLPPEITAKIQAYQPGACSQNRTETLDDAPLPEGVTILTVFVTKEESAALRQYSVQWIFGSPDSPKPDLLEKGSEKRQLSRTLSDSPIPEEGVASGPPASEFETSYLNANDCRAPPELAGPLQNYQGTLRHAPSPPVEFERESSGTADPRPPSKASSTSSPGLSRPSVHSDQGQGVGGPKHFVDLYMELVEGTLGRPETCPGCHQKEASATSAGICSDDLQSLPSHQDRSCPLGQAGHGGDVGGPSVGCGGDGSDIERATSLVPGPDDRGNLVRLCLYIHTVKGLVMSLLAEDGLHAQRGAIEDVYHSSLASLNGLEVHLSETLLSKGFCNLLGFNFAHYDCIQHILTAQLSPGVQRGQFLRATAMMHTDLNLNSGIREMTVRNASTAVYSCRNPAQETHFQYLATPARNSGAPNPHDSAFSLPGRAKQKLLKYGVNLL